ncbi:MAG: hypothetical protein Q8R47_00925 [Nanoarchaeota archaeon]|nr:hypothetical protein [Nanoarchaeota archaeon]
MSETVDGDDGTDFRDGSPNSYTPTTNYNKEKDLARILIEGTKVVYGKEKAELLNAEFEKLENPNYRRNAEGLTAIVERVCKNEETRGIDTASIEFRAYAARNFADSLLKSEQQRPSMLKVAVRGTLNLVNKTCWYYPFVGALPEIYQEKIAEKLGDDPLNYSSSNWLAESLTIGTIAGYYAYIDAFQSPASAAFGVGLLTAGLYLLLTSYRREEPAGSPFITLPYYATTLSTLAIIAAGKGIKDAITGSYSSAGHLQRKEVVKLIPVKPIPRAETGEELLKKAAASLQTPAIVNPLYVKEEGPEEYDAELEDFDQRLEESKRSRNI